MIGTPNKPSVCYGLPPIGGLVGARSQAEHSQNRRICARTNRRFVPERRTKPSVLFASETLAKFTILQLPKEAKLSMRTNFPFVIPDQPNGSSGYANKPACTTLQVVQAGLFRLRFVNGSPRLLRSQTFALAKAKRS